MIRPVTGVPIAIVDVLASLIHHLRVKGALSDREITEIYEFALLMLEQDQKGDDSRVIVMAREMIEDQLRPKSDSKEGK
jgi:hypothetical protein